MYTYEQKRLTLKYRASWWWYIYIIYILVRTHIQYCIMNMYKRGKLSNIGHDGGSTVGWSDIALFAIFENGHYSMLPIRNLMYSYL